MNIFDAYKDYSFSEKEWIAVDFDGTLASYDGWKGPTQLGGAIWPMVQRVSNWLYQGKQVRIFTARCWPYPLVPAGRDPRSIRWIDAPEVNSERLEHSAQAIQAIQDWCLVHFGKHLDVTCVKDLHMSELWDDRAVQVEHNTGAPTCPSPRGYA